MSKLSYPEMCIDDVLVFGIELTLIYMEFIDAEIDGIVHCELRPVLYFQLLISCFLTIF